MAQHRIAKSALEREVLAAMTALAAAYSGPITHCPPGATRGHEVKASYEPQSPSSGAPRQGLGRVLTIASGNVRFWG